MADNSVFGHSLKLVDGDLVLLDGRLVEISGRANLAQALTLRILTPFSTDIFNSTYGLDIQSAFTEPNTVQVVKQIIKLNLVRTLGTDGRVHDIQDIVFEDDPQYLERHPEVSPQQIVDDRHRRFWQVDVIVTTVDNQTLTLAANIGV